MKVEIKKLGKVQAPKGDFPIVAFETVEFKINFYGKEIVSRLDTKIMQDGSQVVIDGDGFIPHGYQVV